MLAFLLRGAQLFFTRVIGAVLTYVLQVLLSRWLGAEELGAYLFAFALCVLMTNMSMLGYGAAAMRFVVRGLETGRLGEVRGYVGRAQRVALGTSLVAAIGTVTVAWWSEPQHWPLTALAIAGMTLPFYALLQLQGVIGHALSWFTFWNLPNNILRPCLLLGAVFVLHRAGLLSGAATVMAVHALIIVALVLGQSAIFRRGLRSVVGDAAPIRHEREWLRTALPLALVSLFTTFYGEVNVVMAGLFLARDELAVFNVTYRTALFLGFVLMAVDSAQLPRLSRSLVAGDMPAVRNILHRGGRAKCFGTLAGLVFLAAAGKFVLGWFGDPRYVAGYWFLLAFCVGFLGRAMIGPAGSLLSFSGHQDRCVHVYATGLVAIAVLDLVLVPWLGTAGAVATVVIVMLACDLALHAIARRTLGVRTDLFAR